MLKQLLSVFLESSCPTCQRSTSNVLCDYCQQKLHSHQLSDRDRLKLYEQKSLFAWGSYDGQLKRAIALMKYSQKPEIGSILGKLLGQAWIANSLERKSSRLTVVPIPLHTQKQQERGYNQAEIIARGFCQATGYRLNTKALVRTKYTAAMFDLNPEQRLTNLQDALKVDDIPKHPVILIDDIHTTGTTVLEAIKTLKQQQIEVLGTAVAAKAGKVEL